MRNNMFKSNRYTDQIITDENGVVYENVNQIGYQAFSLTEQAGYKPPRLQVLDFLTAGERLIAANKEKYYQSDIEPLYDDDGNVVLPKLARSYDPLEAKQNLDIFNSKMDHYKELVYKRKQEEYERRKAEHNMYKDFYDKNVQKAGDSDS